MKLRLPFLVLLPTALVLSTSIAAQPICYDHPNPLKPRYRVAVDCPTVTDDPASTKNARRALPYLDRRDQLSYNGSDYLQIDFTCIADAALCAKAKTVFQRGGEIISGVIVFNTPVTVNATFVSFCSALNDCGTSQYITLGGTYPARTIVMQDSDGIGRYYPQALVKQLNVTTHPQYGPYDITSMFNADAPFWYDDGTTISENQSDFLWVIVHEFMHGLGFYSNWNDYINQTPQALTPDVTQYDTGAVESITQNSYTFSGFYESAFDKYMVVLPKLTSTTATTKSLDEFNGGIGTQYSDFTTYFLDFVQSPQYQLALQMYQICTTARDLGFMPANGSTADDVLVLETSLNPFAEGSSISHVDYNTYTNTSDFLMRYLQDRGVTLSQAIARGGGGPIGPRLIRVLESLGYSTINNPNVTKTVTSISTGTSIISAATTVSVIGVDAARIWIWLGLVVYTVVQYVW